MAVATGFVALLDGAPSEMRKGPSEQLASVSRLTALGKTHFFNEMAEYAQRDEAFREYVESLKTSERSKDGMRLLGQLSRGIDGEQDIGHRLRLLRVLVGCLEETPDADRLRVEIAGILAKLGNRNRAAGLYRQIVANGMEVTTGPLSFFYRSALKRYYDLIQNVDGTQISQGKRQTQWRSWLKTARGQFGISGEEKRLTLIDLELLVEEMRAQMHSRNYKEALELSERILAVAEESPWAGDAHRIRRSALDEQRWGSFYRRVAEEKSRKYRLHRGEERGASGNGAVTEVRSRRVENAH